MTLTVQGYVAKVDNVEAEKLAEAADRVPGFIGNGCGGGASDGHRSILALLRGEASG